MSLVKKLRDESVTLSMPERHSIAYALESGGSEQQKAIAELHRKICAMQALVEGAYKEGFFDCNDDSVTGPPSIQWNKSVAKKRMEALLSRYGGEE